MEPAGRSGRRFCLGHALEERREAGGAVAEPVVPRVPGVDVRCGDPQHARADRADHQRRPGRPRPARQQLAVARAVEAALEVDAALAQQRTDDREGLLEARHALVEGETEGAVLGLVPARAKAQDEAATADLVDGRRHLGQQGWRTEAGGGDQRPQLDPLGGTRQGGQHRPAFPRPARRPARPAVEEVVAEPQRVEPDVLGGARHGPQFGPADLALDLRQLHADAERPTTLRHGTPPSRRAPDGATFDRSRASG